jgi:hypothetical protein
MMPVFMKTIGICPPSLYAGWKATFDALGEALNVSFEKRAFGDDRNLDGWIVLAADRKFASEIGRATRPCYVVLDQAELTPQGTSSKITFANRSELTSVLRGRDIRADDAVGAKALPPWFQNVVPLAFKDGSAIWAIQDQSDCRHHYVALPPPQLNNGEALFTHFSGQRMACLLPLVLFVRSLAEDPRWKPPPLQATFMFDDPNLHWTSYGFVDYGEMARRAVAGNYHVSIATIPLDAWFVHPPTRAIFKENTGRMSLLYHGNDHVSKELARSQSPESLHRILCQAAGRIARMEARTGLEVARIMAPPHGACGEAALSEMARLGFEAVCVSRGSLRHYNNGAGWTRTIGMRPCDVVAGLPVIPRFGLSKKCRNDILIAALLRQPIVPMTHHQGVADGYHLLDEMASLVNSLGEVAWRDMKTISRSLYSWRQEGEILWVSMLSARIRVPVPPGIARIQVQVPRVEDSAEEAVFWRTVGENRRWKVVSRDETIAVQGGTTIEIALGPIEQTRGATHSAGQARLVPAARRLLTEVRDRALPSVHRIVRRGRSSRLA